MKKSKTIPAVLGLMLFAAGCGRIGDETGTAAENIRTIEESSQMEETQYSKITIDESITYQTMRASVPAEHGGASMWEGLPKTQTK